LIAVSYEDFSDYLKWFKVFCHLNGRPELWESVALAALDEVVDVLCAAAPAPGGEAPRVLSLFAGAQTLQANTRTSTLGGMLEALHAVNVIDRAESPWPADRLEVNLETLYVADPDVILIQCHGDEDSARTLVSEQLEDDPIWQSLTAVREGRVYYLDRSLFHNKPNHRFAEAYATLAKYLYPQ
jgi:iron complex transport system substrate-binding protein